MLNFFNTILTSSVFYFSLSALILLFAATRKNNNYFDVRRIFREHLGLFRNSIFQYFVFYGTPLLMSIGTVIQKIVDDSILVSVNIVISIFMSMLFAILSSIGNLNNKTENCELNKLLSETYTAILFEAILCICALIISFAVLFSDAKNAVVMTSISIILYYLVYAIILQVFIIVKRLSVLLREKNK